MPIIYSKSWNSTNQVGWWVLKITQLSILNILFKVQMDGKQPQYIISTEVDRNTPVRQVSSETHMVHQQRHMPSGENKLERDSKLITTLQYSPFTDLVWPSPLLMYITYMYNRFDQAECDWLYPLFYGRCVTTAGEVYSSRTPIYTLWFSRVSVLSSVIFIPGFVIIMY